MSLSVTTVSVSQCVIIRQCSYCRPSPRECRPRLVDSRMFWYVCVLEGGGGGAKCVTASAVSVYNIFDVSNNKQRGY